MELDLDFALDGLAGLDDLISQENFGDFPFLGADADLETGQAEQPSQKIEGIQAQDLSSLLEQFEEASQSLDGTDFSKAVSETMVPKCKSLPASRVCSAANSPANTPPATPPPCVLDKIRARQGQSAKRKSAIMLPMGAPTKRSRGQATTLELPASASGSSKLQRVLSRNNLCPVQAPASQSPKRTGRGGRQNTVPANGVSVGAQQVFKTVSVPALQSGVQSTSSSAPVTMFSSQPVILGSNVSQPVPLVLSAVNSTVGQQNIPIQLVLTSFGTSTAIPLVHPTASCSSSVIPVSSKTSVAKSPPLKMPHTPRTHFTTVYTRAEGIHPSVLDSVMDHDYCANSPRRVIIDEFELDLSPTKPVHKVKSMPIIKPGHTSSRGADLQKGKSSCSAFTAEAVVPLHGKKNVSPALPLLTCGEAVPVQQTAASVSDTVSVHAVSVEGKKGFNTTLSLDVNQPVAKDSKLLHNVQHKTGSGEKDVPINASVGHTVQPAENLAEPDTANHHQLKPAAEAGCSNTDSCKGQLPETENRTEQVTQKGKILCCDTSDSTVEMDAQVLTAGSSESTVPGGLVSQHRAEPSVEENKGAKPVVSTPSESDTPMLLSMPIFDDDESSVESASKELTSVPCASPGKADHSSSEPAADASGPCMPQEAESEVDSPVEHVEGRGKFEAKCNVGSSELSDVSEISDVAVVPHSPGHFDDIPASVSTSVAHCSSQNAGETKEQEMYTEEELAHADRERFIRFEEEEREKNSSSHRGRGTTDRGSRKSRQQRRWRPGSSPVKEDSSSFFNKIPSYYTALSTPTKTGRKQLTADGLEGMSITDFIPQDRSPSHESASYSKLPAYHSCFTNSTKYDDAAAEDSSCHGSDYSSSKPVYSFEGSFSECRQSRSKSRSRSRSVSRERSTSRGRSRKRVRSASSSDSSRSRSRSQSRKGCKRSRRSPSFASCSSSSSASRSRSSSRSLSRSPSRSRDGGSRPGSRERSFRKRQRQKDKIRKMKLEKHHTGDGRYGPGSVSTAVAVTDSDSKEERKIVYVGRIPENYTRKDLRKRFERFGDIEDVSVHFREKGDNYGFVTFFYTCDAYTAIDKGNENPKDLQFDLCFGGRRHFCANDYADLDGNLVIEEEYNPMSSKDPVSFDELLKQAKKKVKRKT